MQEKVRQEVKEKLSGKDVEELLQFTDLDLPYLSAVIKESLRFFPTVTSSARTNVKDCKLGDYHIPKGTFMFLYTTSLNRDPELFDYPDEFLPERFLPDSKFKQIFLIKLHNYFKALVLALNEILQDYFFSLILFCTPADKNNQWRI